MERYWCLQYLLQENITEVNATVWRDNLVRLVEVPFFTKVHSLPSLKPTTCVILQIKDIDTLLMELNTRFVAVVSEPAAGKVIEFDAELNAELEAELAVELTVEFEDAVIFDVATATQDDVGEEMTNVKVDAQ